MRPREVKAKLKEQNILFEDLGKRWKVRPSSISRFIHGKFASARLEKNFARLFGMTVEEFRGDGQPQERKSA
jgi:hypothetical protein